MSNPVTQLVEIRNGYLQALIDDAANPVPTHTIDGISVSATEWRQAMLDNIARVNQLIVAFNPVEDHSVII